jgi:hypothetical protein
MRVAEVYGFQPGLTAMCLRDPECRYPIALLDKRFRTVASAVKAIKQAEQQWWKSLPKDERRQVGQKRKTKAQLVGRFHGSIHMSNKSGPRMLLRNMG